MPLPSSLSARPLLTLRAVEHILAHVRASRALQAMRTPSKPERRQAWRRAMTVGCLESAARHGGRLA